jgi:hypothetical protein
MEVSNPYLLAKVMHSCISIILYFMLPKSNKVNKEYKIITQATNMVIQYLKNKMICLLKLQIFFNLLHGMRV